MVLTRKQQIIVLASALVLFITSSVIISYIGRRSEGITEVQIPPETKEYLRQLGEKIGDLRFFKKEGSGKDRTNRDDDAEADTRGFRKLASENFIVYYHPSDKHHAKEILRYAESSKERIHQVFNHFPYAQNKNGRKLPIYLASSYEEYQGLSRINIPSVACVTHDVYDDALIATMYVSPSTFAQGDEYAQHVIVHEVAHYTHFDVVNLQNIRNLRMWFTEGLAGYTAEEEYRLRYLQYAYQAKQIISLMELSSYSDTEAYRSPYIQLFYAEGYSVLQMVEEKYGQKTVTLLILTVSQKTDIGRSISQIFHLTLSQLNQTWFDYLSSVYVVGR